jgi:hypothetical protein
MQPSEQRSVGLCRCRSGRRASWRWRGCSGRCWVWGSSAAGVRHGSMVQLGAAACPHGLDTTAGRKIKRAGYRRRRGLVVRAAGGCALWRKRMPKRRPDCICWHGCDWIKERRWRSFDFLNRYFPLAVALCVISSANITKTCSAIGCKSDASDAPSRWLARIRRQRYVSLWTWFLIDTVYQFPWLMFVSLWIVVWNKCISFRVCLIMDVIRWTI